MMIIAILSILLLAGCTSEYQGYEPQDGDIIFQTSQSAQSQAVQAATGSRYSHMGLVFLRDGRPFVLEAVQPVKVTPLATWIAAGEDGHFTVRRLIDRDEAPIAAAMTRMTQNGIPFLGRDYDRYFEWSDDRIYCSELVWKIYAQELGIELAPLETFGDFNLTHPAVIPIIASRWPDGPPLTMPVISPSAILTSPLLTPPH